jgi:hypothetical protein
MFGKWQCKNFASCGRSYYTGAPPSADWRCSLYIHTHIGPVLLNEEWGTSVVMSESSKGFVIFTS